MQPVPRFSGLISVTLPGLHQAGLHFHAVHRDAQQMAAAAASTHEFFGWGSATVPLDLCVEAEMLGAAVDFREDAPDAYFPIIAAPAAQSSAGLPPLRFARRGRLPLVLEALAMLKDRVGQTAVIGGYLPGPLTLAMQILPYTAVLLETAETPSLLAGVLEQLTNVLQETGQAYLAAGADFLTIHEMGGSPGVIGPRAFETLVLPHLQRLLTALSPTAPCVLSVCGRTRNALPALAAAGAQALSVDQQTNLVEARARLGPDPLLFGNLDPVGVLAQGTPELVRTSVRAAVAAGVDALWPGCDLWPEVPAENLRAFMNTE